MPIFTGYGPFCYKLTMS